MKAFVFLSSKYSYEAGKFSGHQPNSDMLMVSHALPTKGGGSRDLAKWLNAMYQKGKLKKGSNFSLLFSLVLNALLDNN